MKCSDSLWDASACRSTTSACAPSASSSLSTRHGANIPTAPCTMHGSACAYPPPSQCSLTPAKRSSHGSSFLCRGIIKKRWQGNMFPSSPLSRGENVSKRSRYVSATKSTIRPYFGSLLSSSWSLGSNVTDIVTLRP